MNPNECKELLEILRQRVWYAEDRLLGRIRFPWNQNEIPGRYLEARDIYRIVYSMVYGEKRRASPKTVKKKRPRAALAKVGEQI